MFLELEWRVELSRLYVSGYDASWLLVDEPARAGSAAGQMPYRKPLSLVESYGATHRLPLGPSPIVAQHLSQKTRPPTATWARSGPL